MPPIVPQPSLVQIVPYYTVNTDINRNIANVLWFRSNQPGTPGLADLDSIAAVFNGNWSQFWGNVGSVNRSYLGCVVTDFSSTLGIQVDTRASFPDHAGNQGAAAPAQVCALISLSNGERFKGGHFRIYLPYIGENTTDAADANNLNATVINNLTTSFNNFTAAMQASGVLGGQQQVLYRHRTIPATAKLYSVAGFKVQPQLATQRRRLRKVARHKKKVVA